MLAIAFIEGAQAVITATFTSMAELQNPMPYVGSTTGPVGKKAFARIIMRQTPIAVALLEGLVVL